MTDHKPKPRRRTMKELAAMWLLVGIGAVLIWQIAQTANDPLPAIPTAQPQPELTQTPAVAQVTFVPPTDTPKETPRPRRTTMPQPLNNNCASWVKSGEYCTNPYAPLTPTPMLQCDDSRLIGGQFCFWPTPTPAIGRMWN